MKKLTLHIFLISLFTADFAFAQISFTRQDFGFLGSSYGTVEFGDYDADGDLDLLVIGDGDPDAGLVYINDAGTFNSGSFVSLPYTFVGGDAKWGDYDADGDLDILIAGQSSGRLTAVLRNEEGTFIEQDFDVINVEDSAVDWGDYDNDGDLDAAVTGFDFNFNRNLYLYKNVNDTLIADTTIDGVRTGDLEFVDYDLDGDLDLFLTGSADGGRFTTILNNDQGFFSESGISIVGMLDASSDFGDFDSDGDLDLLLSGNGSDSIQTAIYRNEISNFVRMPIAIRSIEQSDVKWADFDNDGDLDFVQSGRVSITSGINLTEVYENTGSNFVRIAQTIADSVRNSAISVGDYDNDGDMDFALAGWNSDGERLTIIYSNDITSDNTAPLRPDGSGSLTAGDGSSVELSWDPGSDNETQVSGLTYNLRIGTEPGTGDILSAHITDEGRYMLSRRGNMESRRSYTLYGLPPGTYYWAVQTVDNNYQVSNFFPAQFTLSISAVFEEIDVGLPDFEFGDMAWGDYDNDRDLDLAVNSTVDGTSQTKIYIYDKGLDTFSETGFVFTGDYEGDVEWGDYDNDGDVDLLTGSALYRNDFGSFNQVKIFEPSTSDLLFVDFDNDADLDIYWAQNGNIWRNDNGTFNLDDSASSDITNVSQGNAAWGDYDNDGDKDLIVIGGNYLGYLYRNDNGRFVDWGYDFFGTLDGKEFSTNGYKNADIKWADFDNDGDLDFIIIGEGRNQAVDVVRVTAMYKNNGPDLNNKGQWLFEQTDPEEDRGNNRMYEGVNYGSVHWADFDNDGWRDFIISGSQGTTINASDYVTMIYKNEQTDAFVLDAESNATLRGMGNSAVAVNDIDDDGDLDFLEFGYSGTDPGLEEAARLYENLLSETAVNQPPAAPTGLSYSLHGDTVILTWEPAQDDKTAGLTYNVRIGTNPGTQNIVSASAYPDGKMKLHSIGNAQSATTFKLIGPANNQQYYWSVQAIDAGFKSSPFAEESSFNTLPPSVTIQYPNGGEVFEVDSTIFIDWESSYVSDFRLEYSINNGGNWTEIAVINETFGQSSDEWTIPNTISTQCLVRVIDVNNANLNDVSNNTFTISSGLVSGINITLPNGGEQWEAGSFATIFWEQSGVTSIKVEASYDDGNEYNLIAASTPASQSWYNWQVPNMVAVSCYIRLTDVDNPAVFDVSDQSFMITDTTGPVFDVSEGAIDITSPVAVGYRDTVSVKVTDNTGIALVRLHYRPAGTFGNFLPSEMNPEGDEYSVRLEAAPQEGFQLFVEAMDMYDNRSFTDTIGTIVNIEDTFENQDENVGGNNVENYVLFSIPVDLENKSPSAFLIANNFDDTPDREDYRLYSYQNGSTGNFIEYNNSGFGQMLYGRGFFIISNDDFNMTAGNGQTFSPGNTYSVELPQGWSLIGSPFIYSIPLANVSAVNPGSGVKEPFELWEFNNGSWQHVEVGDLLPWRGYALHLDGPANFRIPPYRETLTKSIPKFTTLNNNQDEWMIRIAAQNGKNKSDFNFAGQLLNASDEQDKYDLNGPPRIENQVLISFNMGQEAYKVTDIRKSNTEGHVWDFACLLNPQEEKLLLNFEGVDNFVESRDYFLIDNKTARSYNLKQRNSIEFVTKGISQKDFKLAVGSKEYLEDLSLGVELYPKTFTLQQNVPNPFNPSTQISFTIKDAAKVKLAVYDVLGQEVALLVNDYREPGNYNTVWDASGQSSGIYFIKLSSAANVAIKRAIYIK